jgi:hypothetical protein
MFAGLPGIGVGTLFYVLMALWMPLRELPRLMNGTSSVAQWKLIARQLFYASGIVATVMMAERVLLWLMGASPQPFSPAALLHSGMAGNTSILAAPVTASLLLLAGVLLAVEVLRLIKAPRRSRPSELVHTIPVGDAERHRTPVQQPLEIG